MSKILIVFVAFVALTQGARLSSEHLLPSFKAGSIQRIVGGTEASIQQFPWIVSLQLAGDHMCGASIVSTKWAHTAGHCVFAFPIILLTVRSGSSYHNQGGTLHQVILALPHYKYRPLNSDYDYGMVKILDSFVLGEVRQIVPLAVAGPTAGELATVCGWGYLSYQGTMPDVLHKVELPIIDWGLCKELYASNNQTITERMLCAGPLEGGQDACQYDSGGPLTINGILVGSVSWGKDCAQPNFPGVYSNTSVERKWILSVINNEVPLSTMVLAG